MNEYHMLTLEQASSMTINELINKYNNAVETIWYYHQKIETLMEEKKRCPRLLLLTLSV